MIKTKGAGHGLAGGSLSELFSGLLEPLRPGPESGQYLRRLAAARGVALPLDALATRFGLARAAQDALLRRALREAPSHLASTLAAAQDRSGNAAVAGAAMRMMPVALPKMESQPGR